MKLSSSCFNSLDDPLILSFTPLEVLTIDAAVITRATRSKIEITALIFENLNLIFFSRLRRFLVRKKCKKEFQC